MLSRRLSNTDLKTSSTDTIGIGKLSVETIAAFKGLSILIVVFHNVIHWMVPENEFRFNQEKVFNFFDHFWRIPIESLISFYGWLGVSFFVFASGYGLTVKYGIRPIRIIQWIVKHYFKLVLLLIPAILLFAFLSLTWKIDQILSLLVQGSLAYNIISPEKIYSAVFWYVGMAFQLYICFLILRKAPTWLLLAVGIMSGIVVGIMPENTMYYLRHNCIGWLPEFVFGMIIARNPPLIFGKNKWLMLFASILLLVLTSLTKYTFAFSGIFFVLILLTGSKSISKSKMFVFLGVISASIYVVHPALRAIWVIIIRKFHLGIHPLVMGLTVFLCSLVVAVIYNKCYLYVRKKMGLL